MKNNNDFRFISLFIIILLISFLYLGSTTYSKYRKQVKANGEATVARWNIKVNNEDIKGKSELVNKIIPEFDENEYVKEDVIAPGSKGNFEITIDATDVDVDFDYEITNTNDTETNLADLRITKVVINDDNNDTTPEVLATLEDKVIKGTIEKNTPETKLKVFIEWYDEEDNTMDNQADTTYAQKENSKAELKLSIKFTQKKTS